MGLENIFHRCKKPKKRILFISASINSSNIIAYSQRNRYVRLAIYTDIFTFKENQINISLRRFLFRHEIFYLLRLQSFPN